MRTDRLRLLAALDQIDLIKQFSANGKQAFCEDLVVQSALLHRLTLLGEACRGISSVLQASSPQVPWAQVIAFRNVLIHEYFGLDLELVWQIVDAEVPKLRESLLEIVTGLES